MVAEGHRTGRVVEEAVGRVRAASHPDAGKLRRALAAAAERYHELGVTSVGTMAGLAAVRDHGNVRHEALHAARRAGELDLRRGSLPGRVGTFAGRGPAWSSRDTAARARGPWCHGTGGRAVTLRHRDLIPAVG
ncbi:MAG: hypothetical protein V5A62_05480 [Haloarculaceae archaeon]